VKGSVQDKLHHWKVDTNKHTQTVRLGKGVGEISCETHRGGQLVPMLPRTRLLVGWSPYQHSGGKSHSNWARWGMPSKSTPFLHSSISHFHASGRGTGARGYGGLSMGGAGRGTLKVRWRNTKSTHMKNKTASTPSRFFLFAVVGHLKCPS
jgi:hypothetical protein